MKWEKALQILLSNNGIDKMNLIIENEKTIEHIHKENLIKLIIEILNHPTKKIRRFYFMRRESHDQCEN